MSLLTATGTLAAPGDLVQVGGPDPNPALADQSSCSIELIGSWTGGSPVTNLVYVEVSGVLPNTWYATVCWNKVTPNALQTTIRASGLYVCSIASCVGVRVRAGPGYTGTLQVGLMATSAPPTAWPGATISP